MWEWQLSWDIVDFSVYQDALAKLKDDLYQINKFKSPFAPTAELDRVKVFFILFFINLNLFVYKMLSGIDCRGDLVNVASSIL